MVEELTIEECNKKYSSLGIHIESLGMDRGINFTTVGIRFINGSLRVCEYLPQPGSGIKECDFYIVFKEYK